MEKDMKDKVDTLLEQIARSILDIPTLEERKMDALDFHEVSVWGLKNALKTAYNAGCIDALSDYVVIEDRIGSISDESVKDFKGEIDRAIDGAIDGVLNDD